MAQDRCGERFTDPALRPFVSPAIQQRVARAGGPWEELRREIARASGEPLALRAKSFTFDGSSRLEEDILEIRVDAFNALDDRERIRGNRNADRTNFGFVYLMASVFAAANDVLAREPSVHKVRLVGSSVVNATIGDTLERIGFARAEVPSRARAYVLHAVPWLGAAVATAFTSPAGGVSVAMLGGAAQFVYELRNAPKPDWILELQPSAPKVTGTVP